MTINAFSGCQLPKITVVIPYYMDWDNLVDTLRAVISQRYPRDCYEIIVLNDGGPSSKGKWPIDVPRDLVVWLDNKDRLGMVGNWNKAVHQGQYTWVWLLHADDLPYSDFMAKVSNVIVEHPDVGMVHTKYTGWSVNPRSFLYWKGRLQSIIRTKGDPIRYGAGVSAVRHVMLGVACSSVVMHRDVFELLGGFDISYPYSADEEFWPRLAREFPVVYIPRRLVRYLFHPEQTSSQTTYFADFWEQYRVVNFKAVEHLGADATDQDWIRVRQKLCRVAIRLAAKCALEREISMANRYLANAIVENPECRNWPLFLATCMALRCPHLGHICIAAARGISAVQRKLSGYRRLTAR